MTSLQCIAIGCQRPAKRETGRCDLHDAIVMAEEARDLLSKVLDRLDAIRRKDRESHDDQ